VIKTTSQALQLTALIMSVEIKSFMISELLSLIVFSK